MWFLEFYLAISFQDTVTTSTIRKLTDRSTQLKSPPFFTPPNSIVKQEKEKPKIIASKHNEIKIKIGKPHDSKSIFLDFSSFSQKIIDIGKKKKTKNKEEEENPIPLK